MIIFTSSTLIELNLLAPALYRKPLTETRGPITVSAHINWIGAPDTMLIYSRTKQKFHGSTLAATTK
jgi:hypothetical protein